jgi:hypothetical protein
MLADHILEQAATESDGTPTRFADDIFATFQKVHVANLLKNLAELDSRISVRDNGSRLLDEIWATILTQFRQQDAADRTHFLRALEPIAQYQPERVHGIVQLAMDDEATPAWKYGLHYYTQKDVLKRLPDFLGVTIFHPNVSRDASTDSGSLLTTKTVISVDRPSAPWSVPSGITNAKMWPSRSGCWTSSKSLPETPLPTGIPSHR